MEKLIDKISVEFLKVFVKQLNVSKTELYSYIATGAWDKALENTCKILKNKEIYKEYSLLSWDKSDDFDVEVCNKIIKNNLIN